MTFLSEARSRRDSFLLRTDRSHDVETPDFEPEPFDDWLERTTREIGRKVRSAAQKSQEPQQQQARSRPKSVETARSCGKPRLKSLNRNRAKLAEIAGAGAAKPTQSAASRAASGMAEARPG